MEQGNVVPWRQGGLDLPIFRCANWSFTLVGLFVTQTYDDPPGAPIDLLGLANLNGPSTTWAVGRPGVSFYELN